MISLQSYAKRQNNNHLKHLKRIREAPDPLRHLQVRQIQEKFAKLKSAKPTIRQISILQIKVRQLSIHQVTKYIRKSIQSYMTNTSRNLKKERGLQ